MRGTIQSGGPWGALLGALLLIALLPRLLIPAGFMPVAGSNGVMVTLCTGQGAVQVMVARDRVPPMAGMAADPHKDGERGHMQPDHCPFAGGIGTPALPMLAAYGLLPVWHLATGPIAFALRTGWISRLAAPPPPSSGPPSFLD